MFKWLEYSCLRSIAFELLKKIQKNNNLKCCNCLENINLEIGTFCEKDSLNGLRTSFIKNSAEHCIAIELLIFEELIIKAPVFHICETAKRLNIKIFQQNLSSLYIFEKKIRKRRYINEINKHVITFDTFFLMNENPDVRTKKLLRYKLLNDCNVEEIYLKCLDDHRTILKSINIDVRALHYAMMIFNKDLF